MIYSRCHARFIRASKSASRVSYMQSMLRHMTHATAGLPFGCPNKLGMTKEVM